MTPVLPFGEVMEAADQLSQEEQEELKVVPVAELARVQVRS
jgi:hypothetical protein